ncbi:hypothetical protein [Pseudonocardia asaccharolytica]|uniref:Lipoprotein n=1 Tax=Pseudonocardia asaccharolytica DSM 44247 = NBRC 16224 TaxID=1123024 RepID=A0A511D785_9PSEU|nr:hypothetical protein [Pseudonocardia asaccharolytica]GEL20659.1 hypothetical protein PA7_44960 [Pseudonocardia asaccharolytica DSM 44247 = NBRC 16224]
MRPILRAALLTPILVAAGACGGSAGDDLPAAASPVSAGSPFCAAVQANVDAARPLAMLAAGTPVAGLGDVADSVRRTNQQVIDAAPPQIRADFEHAAQIAELQLRALETAGGDPAAIGTDPELARRASDPAFAEASRRLQAFIDEHCGALG